ncbi:hypothetical protein ACWD6I_14690 [Streptomyces sp. NPDC002454]
MPDVTSPTDPYRHGPRLLPDEGVPDPPAVPDPGGNRAAGGAR